jgi:hypothetical protein
MQVNLAPFAHFRLAMTVELTIISLIRNNAVKTKEGEHG